MALRFSSLVLPLLTVVLAGCKSDSDSSSQEAGGSTAVREYGAPRNDQIRPGVEIRSRNGSCTSNFLFAANEVTFYIGTAAHCFSPDTNSGVDPCDAANETTGFAEITIENASRPGTLIYSSWDAMQQNDESPGSDLCAFNDFALVQIHADDIDNVHPAAIAFGGPTALFAGLAAVGDTVYSYGQSPFHGGVDDLEEKQGQITRVVAGGLAYRISADNAGLPGDSGSAVLHQDGRALAVLSDIGAGVNSAPVTNGVVNLERALGYAKSGGFIPASTQLQTWPEFSP